MVVLSGTYVEFKAILALFTAPKVAYALSHRGGADLSGGQAGVIEAYVFSTTSALFTWRMSDSALPVEATFTTDQSGAVKVEASLGRPHGAFGA